MPTDPRPGLIPVEVMHETGSTSPGFIPVATVLGWHAAEAFRPLELPCSVPCTLLILGQLGAPSHAIEIAGTPVEFADAWSKADGTAPEVPR